MATGGVFAFMIPPVAAGWFCGDVTLFPLLDELPQSSSKPEKPVSFFTTCWDVELTVGQPADSCFVDTFLSVAVLSSKAEKPVLLVLSCCEPPPNADHVSTPAALAVDVGTVLLLKSNALV